MNTSQTNTDSSRRLAPISTRKTVSFAALVMAWAWAASAQISISNLWNISTTNGLSYVTNQAFERGITINPVTGHTILVSRSGGQIVKILDSSTGADLGTMDANSATVTGGTFNLSLIGAAEDGNIYMANLITSAGAIFRVYRYTNETSPPVVVYSAPLGATGPRWGDTLDVRGSGANTEILLGSGGTQAAILKPTDENLTNFTATILTVSGLSSGAMSKGVSFFTNNTFVAKTTGDTALRLVRYDLGAGTGSVIGSWAINSSITGVKVAITNIGSEPYYLVAGVRFVNATAPPQSLMVYDISGTTAVLISSNNFPTPYTANANAVGTAWIQGDRIVAVATQNGLQGASLNVATGPVAPTITTQPSSPSIVQGGYASLSGSAYGSRPIAYQWLFNATPISGSATNAVLLLTNVTPAQAGNYRLVASNPAGAVTSATAVVTIVPTALSSVLTPLWKLAPGSAFFLANDNNQRGIAYRSQSDRLIVASSTPTNGVHVLDAATGNYLYSLKWNSTLITGGARAVNMVGVDEDGVIYVGNLTVGGNTNDFKVYRWFDDNAAAEPELVWAGNPAPGTSQRWGDNFAVRGSSIDPQLLVASRNSNVVSVIRPAFGPTTPATPIYTDGTLGNYGLSVAFGAGEVFWGKSSGQSLREVSFNLDTSTSATLYNNTNYPTMNIVGVSTTPPLLAGISDEIPNNLRLYDLSNLNSKGLINVDTEFFPTDNANANGTGAVSFGNNRLFALDSNNGIIACEIDPSKIPPVLDYFRAGSSVTLTWNGTAVLQRKATVTGQWEDVPGAVSGYTTSLPEGGEIFFQLRK